MLHNVNKFLMKRGKRTMRSFLFAAICCLGAIVVHGGVLHCSEGYGMCNYKKETLESINVNGSANLDETKVLGRTVVNGSLSANESSMNTLQVNGQAQLKDCSISGEAIINGALSADNTTFDGEISAASQRITLEGCSVASIRMRETASYSRPQVVELRRGTKVSGSITVESGNGEVWLFSDSQVAGEVVGAKVIRK